MSTDPSGTAVHTTAIPIICSHCAWPARCAAKQVLGLLRELDGAAMWPPLHGILAAVLLTVGGFDHRLAVVPSLAGWAMTIVFGFLIARRMVPRGGNLAGAVAALFIALSPSHRAYATDVMLESLGAGLSLAVLYAYLVVVQQPARPRRAGFWLALLLTALVLEKYNYYALVVVALAASELLSHPARYWHTLSGFVRGIDWGGLIRAACASHQLDHRGCVAASPQPSMSGATYR